MHNNKKNRSLRTMVFICVGVLILVLAAIVFIIFYANMPRLLIQAEDKYLERERDVIMANYETALTETQAMADDMAVWKETADFARGKNPNFIRKNWPDTNVLDNYPYNLFLIQDRDYNTVYYEYTNQDSHQVESLPAGLEESLVPLSQEVSALRLHDKTEAGEFMGLSGLFFYEETPYMISVVPILDTRDQDEPAGFLILGNHLSEEYIHKITHSRSIHLVWEHDYDETFEDTETFERLDHKNVYSTILLQDMAGHSVRLIAIDTRDVFQQGQRTIATTVWLLFAALIGFSFLLYFVITRLVVSPIEKINADIKKIETAGGEISTSQYSGNKEFHILSRSINDMLERLKRSNVSLSVVENIIDGIDASIYVTDPHTGELLFCNKKLMEEYGCDDSIFGTPCWTVLQEGVESRCSFCPVGELLENPDKTIVWEETSSRTGRYYRNSDSLIPWEGGRLAHLQHRLDITNEKRAKDAMRQRMKQQELMSKMSRSFISTDRQDVLIQKALEMAGEFMDISKIHIFRFDREQKSAHSLQGWSKAGEEQSILFKDTYTVTSEDLFYQGFEQENQRYIAVNDTSKFTGNYFLSSSGMQSFIAVPLSSSGLWGMLVFCDSRKTIQWTESDIQLVSLIGSVISGVLTRNFIEKKLIRMSSIVEQSPQFIAYNDLDGRFLYLNPSVYNITGYTVDELMEKDMSALFDADKYQYIKDVLVEKILSEGNCVFEYPLRCKDGSHRTMSFSSFITDSKENGIGTIARDVTQQRRMEKELVEAKEQAEESSKAKGDFLSRMSHEIRTPLNAIIGMTGIAQTSHDPERKEYCLNKISEASNHLLGVVNDILDMSKIEAGKFELSNSDFEFRKMIQRVMDVMHFRIEEKEQVFEFNLDPAVPQTIVSDEQRLAQVFTNLLANAVKFTAKGGKIILDIQNLKREADHSTLLIRIIDSGIGISQEQQAKLFQSFEQADGGISRRFGGTGLGLAISKRIIDSMGGRIWVESELNKGAVFKIELPVRHGDFLKSNQEISKIDWSTLHILVADDAPETVQLFRELANSLGFHCECAMTVFEAEKRIKNEKQQYQMLFVRLDSPDWDGCSMAANFLQGNSPDAHAIGITSRHWADIKSEAVQKGIAASITPPLFPSQIVDIIIGQNKNLLTNQDCDPSQDQLENHTRGKRILLVEDVDINREIVMALLEDTGLIIDTAENGVKAIEAFTRAPQKYDMILMDIHMPEMDGYEATKRIRGMDVPNAQTIPIIAMTANVFREDIERCLAGGMNDHVGKPIHIEDLFAVFQKYL